MTLVELATISMFTLLFCLMEESKCNHELFVITFCSRVYANYISFKFCSYCTEAVFSWMNKLQDQISRWLYLAVVISESLHSQAIDFLADDPLGLIPRKTSRTVEMTKKIEVLPDKTGFHRIIFLKFKMALLVKLTRPKVLEDSERVCGYDVAYNSHKHCRVRWVEWGHVVTLKSGT